MRVRSGSLWPGVLLHAANNALILSVASYEDRLSDLFGATVTDGEHLPAPVLLTAAGLAVVGAVLVWLAGRTGGRARGPAGR